MSVLLRPLIVMGVGDAVLQAFDVINLQEFAGARHADVAYVG
ncbi:MAG: hypothetical protein ABJK39_04095 [Hyphomicrobiales bacterium]